jgi:hypothetical protein
MTTPIRVTSVIALLLALVACAGASRPKPDWTSAPDVDIPAFATFGWSDRPGDLPRGLLESRVRAAVRAELLERGYTEASESPDFVMSYETVEYTASRDSSPVSIGIGMGTWGSHVGGSVGASVPVGGGDSTRLQYRLTVRAVEPKANREIWIGTTTSFDDPGKADAAEKAIAGVMEGFPARRR